MNKYFQEITSLSFFLVCSFITSAQNTMARLQHHFCEDVSDFYRIFLMNLLSGSVFGHFCFQIVMLMMSRFSWGAIRWCLKALFTFRNWFLDLKSTFHLHSNSQNVSLVSLCDSFDNLNNLCVIQSIKSFGHSKIKGKDGKYRVCIPVYMGL